MSVRFGWAKVSRESSLPGVIICGLVIEVLLSYYVYPLLVIMCIPSSLVEYLPLVWPCGPYQLTTAPESFVVSHTSSPVSLSRIMRAQPMMSG